MEHDLDRLQSLLAMLAEEQLSDIEAQELSTLLEDDAEARAEYMLYMSMHAELARQASGELDLNYEEDVPDFETETASPAPKKFVYVWGGFAAVAAILLAFFALQRKPVVSDGEIVARLTGNSNSQLIAVSNERRVLDSEGLSNGAYELHGGLVELTLTSGVELVVEGPAKFHFVSAMEVGMEAGKMAAYVPPSGKGFTVDLPDARVIDLGTKFGVEIQGDGTSEVHVYKGLVQVRPKSGDREPFLLHGHEATRFGSPSELHPSRIAVDPNRFIRQLREPETAYSELVLKYRPLIYLPMVPSRDGHQLVDVSGSELHGQVRHVDDLKHMWAHGRIGGGLRFNGTTFRGFASISDYPKTTEHVMSAVAWVKADSYVRWASIMKNWSAGQHGQFHFGLYDTTGQLEAHIDDEGLEVFVIDPKPLPLGVWHHVAFVADGSLLHLYRNGKEVATAPYQTIAQRPDVKQLLIGNKHYKGALNNDAVQFWNGRLDELALFYHALDADAIRELYEAGLQWDFEEEAQIQFPHLTPKKQRPEAQ